MKDEEKCQENLVQKWEKMGDFLIYKNFSDLRKLVFD